jgi:hypothetical protein
MDSTLAGLMNENINMDSTIAGLMNDNINMDKTIDQPCYCTVHIYIAIH